MYTYKEKYTLDFSNITHWSEFHQIIKKELDFPEYYGKNWSAFWDCLTDIVDVEEPLNIEILGAEVLEQKFAGTLEKMIEILKRLNKECVVILDDVYGELDPERQKNIIKMLDLNNQILITTTTLSCIEKDIIDKSNIIKI